MSAVLTPTGSAAPWRTAAPRLALLVLLLLLLYWDTVTAMVGVWMRSETYAHAILVPPISAWLIWRQRQVLSELTPQPAPWLLLPLMAFAALWLMGDLVVVNAATQFSWMAMLVLTVPAVLGWRVTHVILFPLLFLFFAVPIGDFMTQPMMDWTADFTVWALRATGIPVYREGLDFVIPSGNWSVVEACSGVRYLIASFMVGTLFAYLNYTSWQRRLVFMLVSIAVPIVANWVRAYGIVMLGHLSGNTLAVGVDHLVYGWVFFGIVVMVMFLIGARFSEPADSKAAVYPAWLSALGQRLAGSGQPAPGSRALVVTTAVALLIALPHGLLWGLQRLEGGAAAPVLQLPERWASGWTQVPPPHAFKPQFQEPAAERVAGYLAPSGETVGLYLAYYRGQNDTSKLVSSVNVLVHSSERAWNQIATGAQSVQMPGGAAQPWRTARLLDGGTGSAPVDRRNQLTVWRIYWVNGHWVAGDARAKVVGALERLRGRGDDGAALVLWADARTPEQAQAVLQVFVRDNLAELEAALQQTSAQR
jgi:exosortase A